jgi:hypothetical protein
MPWSGNHLNVVHADNNGVVILCSPLSFWICRTNAIEGVYKIENRALQQVYRGEKSDDPALVEVHPAMTCVNGINSCTLRFNYEKHGRWL